MCLSVSQSTEHNGVGLIVAAVAWQVAASGKERKELRNNILQSRKEVPDADDATVSSATVERGAPWSVVPETHISDTQFSMLTAIAMSNFHKKL